MNIKNVVLLTNRPMKRIGIEGYGLHIVENVTLREQLLHNNYEYPDIYWAIYPIFLLKIHFSLIQIVEDWILKYL